MRRFILLCLLFFPIRVEAEMFLSDYYFLEESDVYKEETEFLKREEEIRYQNYYYERVNKGYFEVNPNNGYLLDKNDQMYFYTYYKKCLNCKLNPYASFLISNMEKVRYFVLRDFDAPKAILKSIDIYYKDELITYKIKDSNYDNNNLVYKNHISLDLEKEYDLKDIKIKLIFDDSNKKRIAFMLDSYLDYTDKFHYDKRCYYTNDIPRTNNVEEYTINFYLKEDFDLFVKNIGWYRSSDQQVTYFKKPYLKYQYYQMEKKYIESYSLNGSDKYEVDLSKGKKFYKYYKRDYINIIDEIKSIDDLNNMIINSTMDSEKLDISSNIDFNHNGEYKIFIKYKDEEFFKKVIVDNVIDDSSIKSEEISVNNIQSENKTTTKVIPVSKKKSTTTRIKTTNPIINSSEEKSDYEYLMIFPVCIIIGVLFKYILKKIF